MALGDLFGGFISDIASGLYSELPTEVTGAFADVPQATEPDVTFQPFTVTSGGIGSVTGGTSGTTYDLSPQQQEISNMLMNEAQFRLGGDPRGTLESQFAGLDVMDLGQQMIGTSPFGLSQQQQAAQQAFGLGGQFMGAAAQQPADLNLLRGMFAQQAAGALGGGQPGIPTPIQPYQKPVGDPFAGTALAGTGGIRGAPGDVSPDTLMVTSPMGQQPSPAIGQFGQQALGMGAAGLGTQAPSDIEALRSQYAGLAGQAASDVLTPTAAREASVFERIRATQRPEEERQRLALEERLAQQGRLGVRTAMCGGTPEQLAMSKAQEEAQDRASLAAMQQAQAERQQALGTAQTLGGMFGQQAGLSSQLQSAAQQRAAQLSQLGLSAQQVESQLQSEGLGRATTSAQQAGQLAQLAGGLQAQQAGLGQQYATLGSGLASQRQALDAARQQQMLQALTGGQGLLAGGQGLAGAEQQLGIQALQAGYAPQAALLSALSPALNIASMSDVARRQQGEFGLETQMANINAELARRSGLAGLYGGMFSGAMGLGGSLLGGATDLITSWFD